MFILYFLLIDQFFYKNWALSFIYDWQVHASGALYFILESGCTWPNSFLVFLKSTTFFWWMYLGSLRFDSEIDWATDWTVWGTENLVYGFVVSCLYFDLRFVRANYFINYLKRNNRLLIILLYFRGRLGKFGCFFNLLVWVRPFCFHLIAVNSICVVL